MCTGKPIPTEPSHLSTPSSRSPTSLNPSEHLPHWAASLCSYLRYITFESVWLALLSVSAPGKQTDRTDVAKVDETNTYNFETAVYTEATEDREVMSRHHVAPTLCRLTGSKRASAIEAGLESLISWRILRLQSAPNRMSWSPTRGSCTWLYSIAIDGSDLNSRPLETLFGAYLCIFLSTSETRVGQTQA